MTDAALIYQRLTRRMREEGWPTPKQYGTDNVLQLALACNPAVAAPRPGPRPRPVVHSRTDGQKLHLTISIIGHQWHGKTRLTSAITTRTSSRT